MVWESTDSFFSIVCLISTTYLNHWNVFSDFSSSSSDESIYLSGDSLHNAIINIFIKIVWISWFSVDKNKGVKPVGSTNESNARTASLHVNELYVALATSMLCHEPVRIAYSKKFEISSSVNVRGFLRIFVGDGNSKCWSINSLFLSIFSLSSFVLPMI